MPKILNSSIYLKLYSFLCLLLSILISHGLQAKTKSIDSHLLGLNDLAYLWPTPKSRSDVDALINAEFMLKDGEVWSQNHFDSVLDFAENKVNGLDKAGNEVKISFVSGAGAFKDQLKQRKNWKLVGFRVDPSAPSTEPDVINLMGSIPQIRLIFQPVTVNDTGVVTIHDYTAHLPFNFMLNSQPPFLPDTAAFNRILLDLLRLNTQQKTTSGLMAIEGPLKTNPNLANDTDVQKRLADQVAQFLHSHLSENKLLLIAFMGIAKADQWVFFDFNPLTQGAESSPNSQLLHINTGTTHGFAGSPINNKINSNFVGCSGISTGMLFNANAPENLDKNVTCYNTQRSNIPTEVPLQQDIPNIIANPVMANAINTDCVSCHSESSRRSILGLDHINRYQYQNPQYSPFVLTEYIPQDQWNVRNFGWFTKDVLTDPKAIISWRTANEVANSLAYIHLNYP